MVISVRYMRRILTVLGSVLCSVLPLQRALAHPLHTTLTELTEDRSRGIVQAKIRVFADDFGTSLGKFARATGAPMSPQWNTAAFSYVASVFAMSTRTNASLPVRSCGVTRTADVLWICVEATSPTGLAGIQVRNAMLCNLFDDQVNVVQASFGGSRHSILFTRGDAAKPLS